MSESDEVEYVVEIIDKTTDASGKVLLLGFPDVGLVGAIAVSYLVDKLKLDEAGYIDAEDLPPIVAIHSASVKELIRIYEGKRIVAVFSEIPIPIPTLRPLAQVLIEWASNKKMDSIISITGLAEPRRLDIDIPKVYAVGSTPEYTDKLVKLVEAEVFKDGYIAGINAELLRGGMRTGSNVGVILAQSHFNYPDPGAAATVIKHLPRIIGEEVDVNPLLESAEAIRIQMRDLMRRTQETMKAMQKSKELELPPVYM